GHAPDPARVPLEALQFLAALDVPQPYRLVPPARQQQFSVRRQADGHRVGGLGEGLQLLAGLHVPGADGFQAGPVGRLAVRGEDDAIDALWRVETFHFLAGLDVPQPDSEIRTIDPFAVLVIAATGRQQVFAVEREGHAPDNVLVTLEA